ncbi:MAG TPA: 50S ribosomal protein L23 [Candidatus Paceibacterota bacterium]|nr:50S ribosomal protein L23 [Candidatus Paceibacterota bacterium]HVN67016.1 50S ribosomal protein L23 [Candidatus Sulfotelmatobacter sp.]
MRDIFLINQPIITEKATNLNALGKYVFMVKDTATKPEVKKAVQELYKVDAVAVTILNTAGKTKRYRYRRDERPGFKKAVVTLKEGQKIDLGR